MGPSQKAQTVQGQKERWDTKENEKGHLQY